MLNPRNELTAYRYSQVDIDWIENRKGIVGFDGTLVTLEIIGQKIAKFREDVQRAKNAPKSNKVPDFVEKVIEESSGKPIILNPRKIRGSKIPRV